MLFIKNILFFICLTLSINVYSQHIDSFELNQFKKAEKARKWRYKKGRNLFSDKKRRIKYNKKIPKFYIKRNKNRNKRHRGWR